MSDLPVSVVVVSWERPAALVRCLTALSQQDHGQFEIIVVADTDGMDAVDATELSGYLKKIVTDDANIARARNLGLAEAAGEIVAFIDDDAVAEPTWLTHLSAPFADEDVAAAGGYVRGRNGISFQWKAQSVDQTGRTAPLGVDTVRPTVLTPTATQAIKTEGTNMAFRRHILAEMGGFDPAFDFYFEDTDVNLRLAATELSTAIVPLAQVHHAYLESDRRARNRAPKSLDQLGASFAVFLRKHCEFDRHATVWTAFQKSQHQRLVAHLIAGTLEPGQVRSLMAELRAGYQRGTSRHLDTLRAIPRASEGFRGFPAGARSGSAVVGGRLVGHKRHWKDAKRLAKDNRSVSLFLFSRTALYHKVSFEDGIWVQRGGLFGRSDRSQPIFRLATFQGRLRAEIRRVALQRGIVTE